MAVDSLHHFNLRASQEELLVLRDFYCTVIGLTLGPRHSAADHMAFRCSDLRGTLDRLRQHAVAHTVTKVPLVNEIQIFLRDPSGVAVELNFPASEASS